ncbi:MAG: cardiolipin synthase [Muribaculaceae bacterium]|nr:cardiolipin synthase [Muribaculaceae bacterium]
MFSISDYINTTWVWWSATVIYAVVILSTVVVVVSENRNPVKSLAWVTVLLVVPGLGLILYLIFGRNIQSKRIISRRNRRRLRRLQGKPSKSDFSRLRLSHDNLQLAQLAYNLCMTPYTEGNYAEVFDNGTDKFNALLRDIADARSYINIEYYIIDDDRTGTAVARALEERARAGVTVRLIYDHVGSFKAPNRFFRAMREAGVDAKPFFKVVFPFLGTRINWRNHRKICVIDGRIGYIGGMNIADRYVNGGKMFKTWRDLHLRIEGPAVGQLQQAFAVDWNFMGNPLPEQPTDFSKARVPHPMGMQFISGGPVSRWMNLTLIFQKAISNAKKCVYLQTPYFLPSEGLLHALQMCALARVDVRLMLPRRSDSDMLRWASFSYISECLRAGIKVYLYDEGMLHSKAIIIDDDIATVGSCNFDFRSFEHNFEANMLIYSREFNARMKQIFLRDQAQSVRVLPATWRRRPIIERGMESFMRLFAPIL